jgi:hypothetical protein
MTPESLWNDHTFRTLLDDLFKARKDEAMGKIRLKVLLDYVGLESGGAGRLSGHDSSLRRSQNAMQTAAINLPPEESLEGPILPVGNPFEEATPVVQPNTSGEYLMAEFKAKLAGLPIGVPASIILSGEFPCHNIPAMLEQLGAPFTMPEGALMIPGQTIQKTGRNGQPVNERHGDRWQVKLAPK